MRKDKTILGYLLQYGDLSFSDMPFNHVDSLILSQFVYLKFDGLVPDMKSEEGISVRKLYLHPDFDNLFSDVRYEKKNRALFDAMVHGKRFCDMKLFCHVNIIEESLQTQFCAVTFVLNDYTMYVAFRGTDENIVGWKEDINLALFKPVVGQENAARYLNIVTGKLHNRFYVGGHSKGGNLAVYAAMNCTPEVQDRIERIYCMDGPGFRVEQLKQYGYDKIKDKVLKFLPSSSLVGMLFEFNTDYKVVKSTEKDGVIGGVLQHDPYTWIVEKNDFEYSEDLIKSARINDQAINEWILSLSDENIELLSDVIYELLKSNDARTLIEIMKNPWTKNTREAFRMFNNLDPETKGIITELGQRYIKIQNRNKKESIIKRIFRKRKNDEKLDGED